MHRMDRSPLGSLPRASRWLSPGGGRAQAPQIAFAMPQPRARRRSAPPTKPIESVRGAHEARPTPLEVEARPVPGFASSTADVLGGTLAVPWVKQGVGRSLVVMAASALVGAAPRTAVAWRCPGVAMPAFDPDAKPLSKDEKKKKKEEEKAAKKAEKEAAKQCGGGGRVPSTARRVGEEG